MVDGHSGWLSEARKFAGKNKVGKPGSGAAIIKQMRADGNGDYNQTVPYGESRENTGLRPAAGKRSKR